jgi:hypothetical protein
MMYVGSSLRKVQGDEHGLECLKFRSLLSSPLSVQSIVMASTKNTDFLKIEAIAQSLCNA